METIDRRLKDFQFAIEGARNSKSKGIYTILSNVDYMVWHARRCSSLIAETTVTQETVAKVKELLALEQEAITMLSTKLEQLHCLLPTSRLRY